MGPILHKLIYEVLEKSIISSYTFWDTRFQRNEVIWVLSPPSLELLRDRFSLLFGVLRFSARSALVWIWAFNTSLIYRIPSQDIAYII